MVFETFFYFNTYTKTFLCHIHNAVPEATLRDNQAVA
jgi:hypothetical protein